VISLLIANHWNLRLSTGALIALIDHSLSYHAALFFQGKSSQSLEVAPYALAIFY